jgi:hypothetical protein
MNYFSELTEKKNMPQLILVILFVIYLVLGLKMPSSLANIIDTTLGKVIIALVALMLFAYSNPVLGVLGLLVAYQLIRSASIKTGMAGLEEYYPTEDKKWTPFTPIHQFPYTLEQEVVKNMTTQKFNSNYVKSPYRPALDDTHDAQPLNQ